MKITMIGGGNIGTLMAAELAHKGNEVTMYTSKPERWSKQLAVLDEAGSALLQADLAAITGDLQEALRGAQMVFVTVPAQMFAATAQKMLPYVGPGLCIGVVPGSGGAEFAFRPLIEKGCVLFGFQRVHSIARLKEYGHSVHMLGRKSELQLAAIPANKAVVLAEQMERWFAMPCVCLEHYLAVTLTPSNPILHTSRLYAMFRNHVAGQLYPRNFLFYEEWDDASSEMLIACDQELQALCEVLPLKPGSVKSLKLHYESETPQAMTWKISHIEAFKGLTSPMRPVGERWTVDWDSRYFTADFSYGLKIICDIADLFGVPAPHLHEVWAWYAQQAPQDAARAFQLGMTKEELLALYQK